MSSFFLLLCPIVDLFSLLSWKSNNILFYKKYFFENWQTLYND